MTSYREQVARIRALPPDVPVAERRVVLFKPHETAGELERVFTCVTCFAQVAVGPFWEHKVDGEFVCGGCQRPATFPMDDPSSFAPGGVGRAGTGQEAVV